MCDERTLKMKQNYYGLWQEGLSNREITHRFDLSVKTGYNHLEEIALEAGLSGRDELLVRPRAGSPAGCQKPATERISLDELREDFAGVLRQMDDVITKATEHLAELDDGAANEEEVM